MRGGRSFDSSRDRVDLDSDVPVFLAELFRESSRLRDFVVREALFRGDSFESPEPLEVRSILLPLVPSFFDRVSRLGREFREVSNHRLISRDRRDRRAYRDRQSGPRIRERERGRLRENFRRGGDGSGKERPSVRGEIDAGRQCRDGSGDSKERRRKNRVIFNQIREGGKDSRGGVRQLD